MLYDTVGPALLETLPSGRFPSTLEMKTNFLRPASRQAPLFGDMP